MEMYEELAELVAEIWLSRQCDISLLAADMQWPVARAREALEHPMVERATTRLAVQLLRARRQNKGLVLSELQKRLERTQNASEALEIARTMAVMMEDGEGHAAVSAKGPTVPVIQYVTSMPEDDDD